MSIMMAAGKYMVKGWIVEKVTVIEVATAKTKEKWKIHGDPDPNRMFVRFYEAKEVILKTLGEKR
jgi:hypothetical protein